MGSTTSPHIKLDAAQKQLELTNLLPVLYINGISSYLPYPPDIFAQIIRVNRLRAQFQAVASDDPGCPR